MRGSARNSAVRRPCWSSTPSLSASLRLRSTSISALVGTRPGTRSAASYRRSSSRSGLRAVLRQLVVELLDGEAGLGQDNGGRLLLGRRHRPAAYAGPRAGGARAPCLTPNRRLRRRPSGHKHLGGCSCPEGRRRRGGSGFMHARDGCARDSQSKLSQHPQELRHRVDHRVGPVALGQPVEVDRAVDVEHEAVHTLEETVKHGATPPCRRPGSARARRSPGGGPARGAARRAGCGPVGAAGAGWVSPRPSIIASTCSGAS